MPSDSPSDDDTDVSTRPWAGYDELAGRHGDSTDDDWTTPWGDNPLQRHYSWPATRDLLPTLDDERVLDAGCGVGDHVDWLLDRGATVTGIDASEQAVETAADRFDDRATFRHAVLSEPLPFEDAAFDVVLSHLVLDHVADLDAAFESLHRVLADGGTLVFTMIHPMQLYLAFESVERYYDRQPVELGWDAPVRTFHRPVTDILTALADAGFRLDRALEPEPPESYLPLANEEWQVDERPQILCVRATAA
ncbi:class I SAM-dependent methyltransferase [Haloarchaeobius baliensis]|uniref:class I SAM-dependent methyltransferase n=1 Tax=Haloarchaeobius baliensis TaxID=1670458 RepID=UPI003F882697